MAILVDGKTKVICQGITGSAGAFHTRGCLDYGTKMVGGVTPGKGGAKDPNGLPIFDTVADAVRETGASATMIFVPPPFAGDAILEAAAAGIKVICAITEGIPTQDMIRVRAVLKDYPETHLIGPNCPGVITPGRQVRGQKSEVGGQMSAADDHSDVRPLTSDLSFTGGCKIGIMPGYIHLNKEDAHTGKAVGVISRSGTLTYEAVWQCTSLGIGQSTCVGIGGDPVRGLGFIELLKMFEDDRATDGVVMIGEIGGQDETDAGLWIKKHMSKPVVAFIAGRTAPKGKRMGHAGAIIGGADDTAQAKIESLRKSGVQVAQSPAEIGATMAEALGANVPVVT
jgi:succinyl-CoA synthetase alpha subunit